MDNTTQLKEALKLRNGLVKLNKKIKNPNNIWMPLFVLCAYAIFFIVWQPVSSQNSDNGLPILAILSWSMLASLFLYFVVNFYKFLTHKYTQNIFDADDLALIKSDPYLSYYFKESLKTDNGQQYISASFKDRVKEYIIHLNKNIAYLEVFESKNAIEAERIKKFFNDDRSKKFRTFQPKNS